MPHSLAAERAVLGAALLNAECFPFDVPKEAFYSDKHKAIRHVMDELRVEKSVIDQLTVVQKLRDNGVDNLVPASYVVSLTNEVPSISSAEHYAKIVLDMAARRRIIGAAHQIVDMATDTSEDIQSSVHALLAASREGFTGKHRDSLISDGLVDFIDELERAYNGELTPGLSTGIRSLDDLCRLHPGDLIVIGARPGMGKTALAITILAEVAKKGGNALFFSLEMDRRSILRRLISYLGGPKVEDMRTGKITSDDFAKISHAASLVQKFNLVVDDSAQISSSYIRAVSERRNRDGALSLIVVDYLQRMREPGKHQSKHHEFSQAIQGLKTVAKEMQVPLIALAQLNREVERRKPPRPILSDLKESGDIEQEADTVWFLYRQEYYEGDNTPIEKKGTCLIDVAKNRDGRCGEATAHFSGAHSKFSDKW